MTLAATAPAHLRDRLDAALAGVAHVTEHVGSTAVRGLAAKPIIDVDVVVADQTAASARAAHLTQLNGDNSDQAASGDSADVPRITR